MTDAPARVGGPVLTLDDPAATSVDRAGSKAAALARARSAGLPVLDGFVIRADAGDDEIATAGEVRRAWESLSGGGTRSLVVRSSSALEDTAMSSMAGQFTTVVDVRGWEAFLDAVDQVRRSGEEVATRIGASTTGAVAVLVQPLLVPEVGGVMFGVDPVTGRTDRRVIAAVKGQPEQLVSGAATGSRYEVDDRGRVKGVDRRDEAPVSRRVRHALVHLGDRCREVFGGPQDVEWAVDGQGTLWLLQSRPVTTAVAGVPQGPVLGPGPVAETFPDPLSRLEQDLWVEPLRQAVGSVFGALGVVSPRHLRASPLLVTVGGRPALDLDLLEAGRRAPWYALWYALGRRIRLLRVAWRIGRLRNALVAIGEDVVDQADAALLEVPRPDALTERQLVAALERFREALHSLHSHEMLVGLVLDPGEARLTASSVALRVLAQARAEGVGEADLAVQHPVVLALVPPRVGPDIPLPREVALPEWSPGDEDRAGLLREALRLRVRWVQEAGARFAWELGERLTDRKVLAEPAQIRHLDLEALEMTVRGLAVTVPEQLAVEPPRQEPLPARFRLSDHGVPIPVLDRHPHQGAGAGGGRKVGRVHLGTDDVPDGAVLVVQTLDARLAPLLGRLNGIVAETGSVLSHLAILAREARVPAVVGLEGATQCLQAGMWVEVDGATGAVTPLPGPPPDADGGRS